MAGQFTRREDGALNGIVNNGDIKLDTLEIASRAKLAGFSEMQAEEMARLFNDTLATKDDLRHEIKKISARFQTMQYKTVWMTLAGIAMLEAVFHLIRD